MSSATNPIGQCVENPPGSPLPRASIRTTRARRSHPSWCGPYSFVPRSRMARELPGRIGAQGACPALVRTICALSRDRAHRTLSSSVSQVATCPALFAGSRARTWAAFPRSRGTVPCGGVRSPDHASNLNFGPLLRHHDKGPEAGKPLIFRTQGLRRLARCRSGDATAAQCGVAPLSRRRGTRSGPMPFMRWIVVTGDRDRARPSPPGRCAGAPRA